MLLLVTLSICLFRISSSIGNQGARASSNQKTEDNYKRSSCLPDSDPLLLRIVSPRLCFHSQGEELMTSADTVTTTAGVVMPRIIYGTAWKKEATTSLVVKAVLAGFRGIDTACQPKHYYEPGVGEALRILSSKNGINRDQLFIQTKFTSLNGQDPANIPYDKNADLTTQVKQSLAKSLENLGTTYLDSLVLHSPMRTFQETIQVWREFEEFVKSGRVKQLGISNCYDIHTLKGLYDQAVVKPAVLQNRFYSDSDYDKGIREFCHLKGIYYQSFWTLTANDHLLKSPPLVALASRHNKTPTQVWFKYVTQRHNIVLLTGTKDEQHMKQDLDILDWEIDDSELQELDSLIE